MNANVREVAGQKPGVHEGCISTEEREKLRNRLRRIEGQVRGIARIVERDAPSVEILTQLASFRAAAEKAALLIIKDHTEYCVHESIRDGPGLKGRLMNSSLPSNVS